MNITKISNYSGIKHTLDIPVTLEQLGNWKDGMLIQKAMPNLSVNQREFLISGITSEEFAEIDEQDKLDYVPNNKL